MAGKGIAFDADDAGRIRRAVRAEETRPRSVPQPRMREAQAATGGNAGQAGLVMLRSRTEVARGWWSGRTVEIADEADYTSTPSVTTGSRSSIYILSDVPLRIRANYLARYVGMKTPPADDEGGGSGSGSGVTHEARPTYVVQAVDKTFMARFLSTTPVMREGHTITAGTGSGSGSGGTPTAQGYYRAKIVWRDMALRRNTRIVYGLAYWSADTPPETDVLYGVQYSHRRVMPEMECADPEGDYRPRPDTIRAEVLADIVFDDGGGNTASVPAGTIIDLTWDDAGDYYTAGGVESASTSDSIIFRAFVEPSGDDCGLNFSLSTDPNPDDPYPTYSQAVTETTRNPLAGETADGKVSLTADEVPLEMIFTSLAPYCCPGGGHPDDEDDDDCEVTYYFNGDELDCCPEPPCWCPDPPCDDCESPPCDPPPPPDPGPAVRAAWCNAEVRALPTRMWATFLPVPESHWNPLHGPWPNEGALWFFDYTTWPIDLYGDGSQPSWGPLSIVAEGPGTFVGNPARYRESWGLYFNPCNRTGYTSYCGNPDVTSSLTGGANQYRLPLWDHWTGGVALPGDEHCNAVIISWEYEPFVAVIHIATTAESKRGGSQGVEGDSSYGTWLVITEEDPR